MRTAFKLQTMLSGGAVLAPPAPAAAPVIGAQTTGVNGAGSTSIVVTLPAYIYPTDVLLLWVDRNGTNPGVMTGDANVTLTELAQSGTRLMTLIKVVPVNGSITSFTLSQTTSQLTRWTCQAVSGVDATRIIAQGGPSQTDSTSTIAFTNVTLTYTTNGTELILGGVGVNSTASFTTDANTVYNSTTGNTAMMIEKATATIGQSSIGMTALDRGNNGASRAEASILVVLTGGVSNFLVGGGFEEGSTLGTGWTGEVGGSPAATPATFSLSTSTGLAQGVNAQRMQYSGEVTNNGSQKVEYYQAVDNFVVAGQSVRFRVKLSGSVSGGVPLLVIEAHDAINADIGEKTTNITVLNVTPTEWIVDYVNLPAGTTRVVLVVLVNELSAAAAVNLFADQAVLERLV